MKRFSTLILVLISAVMIGACGAGAARTTPTANAVDMQSTMAAAAYTLIAQTQAAIPTSTPITPTATLTSTPAVANTIPPLPSLAATFTAAPGGNAGGQDPCVNATLPHTLQGDTVRIRVTNSTQVSVSLTVYLDSTAPQDVCGYRSYTLASQESIVINNLVEGCYTLWAWNPDPSAYFIVTNGTDCLDNSTDNWAFDISTRDIRLR